MSTNAVRPVPPAASRAASGRPGYDRDAETTARRVLPMLAEGRVVWLSTVHPDGSPHLVPTWFWWDGDALLFWSKPGAVKVRNLLANPRLMVAVGDAAADFWVGLIEAIAEPVDVPVPEAFFEKYASELAGGQLDREAFGAVYTQAMRVVPTRFLAWHGRGRRHDPAVASPARPHRPWATLAEGLAAGLDRMSARLRAMALGNGAARAAWT